MMISGEGFFCLSIYAGLVGPHFVYIVVGSLWCLSPVQTNTIWKIISTLLPCQNISSVAVCLKL